MKKITVLSICVLLLFTAIYALQAQLEGQKPRKKVLFVLSGVDFLEGNKSTRTTGYWLEEVAVPYKMLTQANIKVVFATPNGHRPKADPLSYALDDNGNPLFMASKQALDDALHMKENIVDKVHIHSLAILNKQGLETFDAVFFPGGHGPMQDLAFDANVAKTLAYFHETQKITALLCHGPAALLSTAFHGAFLYKGYKIAAYTNTEEAGTVYDEIGGFKALGVKLGTALVQAGADYQMGPDFSSFVVEDRELITGQNPASSQEIAEKLVQKLK